MEKKQITNSIVKKYVLNRKKLTSFNKSAKKKKRLQNDKKIVLKMHQNILYSNSMIYESYFVFCKLCAWVL